MKQDKTTWLKGALPWNWFKKDPIPTYNWTHKDIIEWERKYKIRSWVVGFYTILFLLINGWLEYGMIDGIKNKIDWYNYGQYWGNGIAILLTPLFTHGIQGIFVASSKPKVDMKIDIPRLKISKMGLVFTILPLITLIISLIIIWIDKSKWKKDHLRHCLDCRINPRVIQPRIAKQWNKLDGITEENNKELNLK
ncbi:hypothetical protein [Spiroplasma endosymbiont of Poecilobothrus nobilitatus]|uniref:hypothetical protein n=1 Tax=Spiroplasma endosymbiont of Poecilobothrus nobilitatus TaxID=1209220 RepID=UPI00313D752F